MKYQAIREAIEKADKISLFRHTHPDGDAAGSQLGLKEWILANYPQKDVRAVGAEHFDTYPYTDETEDEFISGSLAIVTDTSNSERVDDQRFKLAKEIIRIDHHPIVETFEDQLYCEPQRGSVCEYIAEILMGEDFMGTVMPKKAAEYLYSGILTDTLNFRTSDCDASTLKNAARLVDCGLDMNELSVRMFDVTQREFFLRTKIRNHFEYEDGLCFVKLDKEAIGEMGITASDAKIMIDEFGQVQDFKIWAVLAYNTETGLYDGSLRSKHGYIVNLIASNYNGGGHDCAAGIKNLSEEDVENCRKDLLEEICRADKNQHK